MQTGNAGFLRWAGMFGLALAIAVALVPAPFLWVAAQLWNIDLTVIEKAKAKLAELRGQG